MVFLWVAPFYIFFTGSDDFLETPDFYILVELTIFFNILANLGKIAETTARVDLYRHLARPVYQESQEWAPAKATRLLTMEWR